MANALSNPAVARVLPFGLYIAFLALNGLIPEGSLDTRWLYPVRVGLVALALAFFWRHYDELHGKFSMPGGFWALGTMTGLVVFVLWVNLTSPWMLMGGQGKGFDPRDGDHVNVVLAVCRIAGAALVVPVMEELFWRSFVMRWIDNPKFREILPTAISLKALLLSSVVFGLEHNEWFAGILAGLAYGWLYRVTGNLWVPIVSHALTNGLLGMWVLYTASWQFW